MSSQDIHKLSLGLNSYHFLAPWMETYGDMSISISCSADSSRRKAVPNKDIFLHIDSIINCYSSLLVPLRDEDTGLLILLEVPSIGSSFLIVTREAETDGTALPAMATVWLARHCCPPAGDS